MAPLPDNYRPGKRPKWGTLNEGATPGEIWPGNRLKSPGYRHLMYQVRCSDTADSHGFSAHWLFSIADALYAYTGECVEGYRPGPSAEDARKRERENPTGPVGFRYPDYEDARNILLSLKYGADDDDHFPLTEQDALDVFNVLKRYGTWVRLAGRDY